MQELSPSVVATAVRMLMIRLMIISQVFLFFNSIIYCIKKAMIDMMFYHGF